MRPNRHVSSRVVVLALGLALAAGWALAPMVASATEGTGYSFWYASAQDKVYPTTPAPAAAHLAGDPTPTPLLSLSAARSEFEGRQIAVRTRGVRLQDVWIQPSALTLSGGSGQVSIPAANVTVYKVGYVNVTHPSYGYKAKGLQPDPLIPMTLANGEPLGWRPRDVPDLGQRGVPADATQPFYVLFEVPADAAPGVYTGVLTITASDGLSAVPAVVVPVSLTVYPFSVEQRTLKTAFRLDVPRVAALDSPTHTWLPLDVSPPLDAARVPERTTYALDQIDGWLRYLSDHRISSQSMPTAWQGQPDGSGAVTPRSDVLADYLGTGKATAIPGDRFAFNAIRLPEYNGPSYLINPFTSAAASSRAATYYRSMYAALGADASKAYVYPIDEPHASERAFTQKYAALIHKAIPGAKFLLTTDAGTQRNRLVSGVDIYVYRLHFIFRDSAYIKSVRAAHKEVWIYSHSTDWQKVTPLYLVDKPLTDSRVQAWFAFKARATGLLYFSVNRWRLASSSAVRDPYSDPLTTNSRNSKTGGRLYANGDGSLIYPGYYPRLGLDVEGAPPVGSLRMEALRDGLEDYEYVKLVAGRFGTAVADAFVAGVIGPVPARRAGILQFPAFSSNPATYDRVRSAMAAKLSQ